MIVNWTHLCGSQSRSLPGCLFPSLEEKKKSFFLSRQLHISQWMKDILPVEKPEDPRPFPSWDSGQKWSEREKVTSPLQLFRHYPFLSHLRKMLLAHNHPCYFSLWHPTNQSLRCTQHTQGGEKENSVWGVGWGGWKEAIMTSINWSRRSWEGTHTHTHVPQLSHPHSRAVPQLATFWSRLLLPPNSMTLFIEWGVDVVILYIIISYGERPGRREGGSTYEQRSITYAW